MVETSLSSILSNQFKMRTKHLAILTELQLKIEQLKIEIKDPAAFAEHAVILVKSNIETINESISINGFESQEEEINFFKIDKPQMLSLFFFYNCIYNLEAFKPKHVINELKEYLINKKVEINSFSVENQVFYKYHNSGSTRFDSTYFFRGKFDVKTSISCMYLIVDERFCTFHCYLTSKILANQMISSYIDDSLLGLINQTNNFLSNSIDDSNNSKLMWTASHISFVEFVYALHEDKAINKGDLTITQLMEAMGKTFNIKPGHFSGCYHEMKLRNSPAKYMYYIAEKLLKRMEKDNG